MAYTKLGTRYTYYIGSGTSTPSGPDIRGWGTTYYEQTAEDLANNRSKIKVEFGDIVNVGISTSYTITVRVQRLINNVWTNVDTKTYSKSYGNISSGTHTRDNIANVIIPHNNDGTGQVRTYLTITDTSALQSSQSFAYSYDLPTIQEQVTISDVTAAETNTTLLNYGITANQYVNRLSKKQYTITIDNPNNVQINSYSIENGSLNVSNNTNVVLVDFANADMYTETINNATRPVILANVNTASGTTSTYVNYDTNTYINYQAPKFIPTETTTKRNGQLSGKVYLSAKGTYYNGTIGTLDQGSTYKPTIKYKLWKVGTTEPSTYDYTISASGINTNNGTFTITNYEIGSDNTSDANYFDYRYSYNVKIQVSDTFKNDEVTTNVTVGEAVWTEYKDRVDFKKVTTNQLIAANIDFGNGYATRYGNTVNFNKTFSSVPYVVAIPVTSTSGVIALKITNITTTSFTIMTGGNTDFGNVDINWIAIN